MRTLRGIIPGIHGPEHLAALQAGRARLFSAGGAPRCSAHAKHGGPCGAMALSGEAFCYHHAPNPVRQARRLRLLQRPASAAQLQRTRRKEARRVQRRIWAKDRFAPGVTVDLGAKEDAFQADMRAFGLSPSGMSPATLDQARWCWLGLIAGRVTVDQLRGRVREHLARDAGGPAPVPKRRRRGSGKSTAPVGAAETAELRAWIAAGGGRDIAALLARAGDEPRQLQLARAYFDKITLSGMTLAYAGAALRWERKRDSMALRRRSWRWLIRATSASLPSGLRGRVSFSISTMSRGVSNSRPG